MEESVEVEDKLQETLTVNCCAQLNFIVDSPPVRGSQTEKGNDQTTINISGAAREPGAPARKIVN